MENLWTDIGSFLLAVIVTWASLITGGVLVALSVAWSIWTERSIPRALGISFVVLFGVIATFTAWREQYHSAQDRQKQLDALTKPAFGGEVGEGVLLAPAGPQNSGLIATSKITIWNTAAPSIAKDFLMLAKLRDGRVIAAHTVIQPEPGFKVTLSMNDPARPPFVYDGSEALARVATASPIPTNGQASGYFQGLFSDISDKRLEGAIFQMTFKDIYGHVYTVATEHPWGPGSPSPVALHGLQEKESK